MLFLCGFDMVNLVRDKTLLPKILTRATLKSSGSLHSRVQIPKRCVLCL